MTRRLTPFVVLVALVTAVEVTASEAPLGGFRDAAAQEVIERWLPFGA